MKKSLILFLFIFITFISVFFINTDVNAAYVDFLSGSITNKTQGRYLQKELNLAVKSQISTTGNIGPLTRAAIREFQTIYGLQVDGIVGSITRKYLNIVYGANRVIVSSNWVNIRDKAGFSSNVVGYAQRGEIHRVYGTVKANNRIWYKIYYKGKVAYISENVVRKSFVEIDIVSQTLRVYKDTALVLDTPITTGRLDGINNTTKGYFKVENMYTYNNYDKYHKYYWIGFEMYKGQGIHDSHWRGDTPNLSYYGGKVYKNLNANPGNKTSGSHGCVNVPISKMRILFQLVSQMESQTPGTPIYVH